jgi:hypothetical protein
MPSARVEILNQDIDPEGKTHSYYRMLVNRKHFKYIAIDPGIYKVDDLCFSPMLEMLPSISLRRLELWPYLANSSKSNAILRRDLQEYSPFNQSSVASKVL